MVDSSGYTVPNYPDSIGSQNPPHYFPELQNVYKANYNMSSNRYSGFIQDEWAIDGQDSNRYKLIYGVRVSYWDLNKELLISPRLTFSYRPKWKRDVLLRFFLRAFIISLLSLKRWVDLSGTLHTDVKAQRSIHLLLFRLI